MCTIIADPNLDTKFSLEIIELYEYFIKLTIENSNQLLNLF